MELADHGASSPDVCAAAGPLMTSSIDVIVDAGEGGRRLLQTADSLLWQRAKPASITLIKAEPSTPAPLVNGVASRLGAIVLDGSAYPGLALNAAVRSAAGGFFAVVPAGFTLNDEFIARCEKAFRDDGSVAVAPSIAYRTADGNGEVVWAPEVQSCVAVLSDARSVPPVYAVRRDVWNALAGFDETLSGLVEYEFWVRVVASGQRVSVLNPPFVARELERDVPDVGDQSRAGYYRAVLDRNVALLSRDMRELLISREIRFG